MRPRLQVNLPVHVLIASSCLRMHVAFVVTLAALNHGCECGEVMIASSQGRTACFDCRCCCLQWQTCIVTTLDAHRMNQRWWWFSHLLVIKYLQTLLQSERCNNSSCDNCCCHSQKRSGISPHHTCLCLLPDHVARWFSCCCRSSSGRHSCCLNFRGTFSSSFRRSCQSQTT